MSFDWNKLDSYKAALDDGFSLEDLEVGETEILNFVKYKNTYCMIAAITKTGEIKHIEYNNWETFKKKVADYFLKG